MPARACGVKEYTVQFDDQLKHLVKDRRYFAAFNLLQKRRQTDLPQPQRGQFDELLNDMWRLRHAGTPFSAVLGLFCALLLIIVATIVGLTFVGLRVSEWTLFPAIDRLFPIVMSQLFRPGVLPVLAVAVLVFGLPFAVRFRSPATFVTGLIATSLGLVCFWLYPVYIGVVQRRFPPDAELPLLIVGGVISLFVFVGGIQLMAQANR
jgi:hypothetical protein